MFGTPIARTKEPKHSYSILDYAANRGVDCLTDTKCKCGGRGMTKLVSIVCTTVFSAVVVLLSSFVDASAHHSFAMFDQTRNATIEGTVSEFQWGAPHVWLDVLVESEAGAEPELWGIESQSPRILFNRGWGPDTIKAGERVIVEIHPAKDGRPGGQMLRVTFADGHTISTEQGDEYLGPLE